MIFYYLLSFIFGSAVGSFLNVVIDRTSQGKSLFGRSYCDHCKKTLATFDLVPIVSFVALGARCRYCRRRISWQYPVVEGLTGLLFVLAFISLSATGRLGVISLLYYLILIAVLVVVAVYDFKYQLIPTTFVFLASFVALFYNYFNFSSADFVRFVLGAFVAALFFALVVLVTRGRGMGEGDVILAFMMGMVLGPANTFLALLLGFLAGAVVSLILVSFGRKKFGQTIALAPFLTLGFLVSLFWASPILDWYLMLYLK